MSLSLTFISVLVVTAFGLWLADDIIPAYLNRVTDTKVYREIATYQGWLRGASYFGGAWLLVMGIMLWVDGYQ